MFLAYVFVTNMVAKFVVPTNRSNSSQVPAYEKCNRFDSPQVKRDLITRIIDFVYELPHELPNDLRLLAS